MRKSHLNDAFLVLLGQIISRLFTCSNAEKNKQKTTKGACSSPISVIYTHVCLKINSVLNWTLKCVSFSQVETQLHETSTLKGCRVTDYFVTAPGTVFTALHFLHNLRIGPIS